jgi:hypothetical protein
MKMIGNYRPGITAGFSFGQITPQAVQKVVAVVIILKNLSAFNASGNNMVQSPRCVYS